MPSFSVATWNINSVRLRQSIVETFLDQYRPDILCLQEIKCEDGQFPTEPFRTLDYDHIAIHGQKAYHGVATLSKHPFAWTKRRDHCGKGDARHIQTGLKLHGQTLTLDNFYIPAGGDIPDREENDKFGHKLDFLKEFHAWGAESAATTHRLAVGDFNIAPYEHDVWSHKQLLKVVSHTPVETDALTAALSAGAWLDLMREFTPEPEKLYTWWSYRARDWATSNKGRRLDHIWSDAALATALKDIQIIKEARGWEKPSDHAPVIAAFEL